MLRSHFPFTGAGGGGGALKIFLGPNPNLLRSHFPFTGGGGGEGPKVDHFF